MNLTPLAIIRFLFWALLGFEFLNWIEILHFEVKFTWLGLIITAGVVYGFIEYLHRYLKKHHQAGMPWIAFVFGFVPVFYDATGDVFYWYDFWWYDVVAHFLGSAMAAAVIFSFFRILRRVNFTNWYFGTKMFFAFTTAVTFGVFFELEEFGEDFLTCYHRDFIPFLVEKLLPCGTRFGNAFDTGADLFFDVLGGLTAVLITWGIVVLRQAKEK